ncbi:MAG TPA: SEC-C metal-binding domain-containing protein [Lacipirellulaceae bacterium]
MRLAEAEIIAGLGHPSIHVREVVADYLEDCGRTQVDVTRQLIAAVERFGWDEVLEFPNRVASFGLDAATLGWAIGEIQREGAGAPSENVRWHLARMISNAPVEVVRPRLAQILELDVLHRQRSRLSRDGWTNADQLQLRNSVFNESPEECWELLDRHCRAIADVDDIADRDNSYAEALIERIVAGGEMFAGRVLQVLQRPEVSEAYEEWVTGWMIELSGRLRLESAAELLYRQFDKDWDWYNDEIMRALIRIGTSAVTALVRERYVESPWHVRLYSIGVFEAVHHDDSVPELMRVLPHEDELRDHLGVALASHFDERGIEPALVIYREDPENKERFTIVERLFAHASLANLDLPEKDEWGRQIAEKWEKFKQSRGDMEEIIESVLEDDDLLDEDDEWLDDDAADDAGISSLGAFSREEEDEFLPKQQSIVRTAPRVGRNERCPCGSGKKYKNCCMRNAPR